MRRINQHEKNAVALLLWLWRRFIKSDDKCQIFFHSEKARIKSGARVEQTITMRGGSIEKISFVLWEM